MLLAAERTGWRMKAVVQYWWLAWGLLVLGAVVFLYFRHRQQIIKASPLGGQKPTPLVIAVIVICAVLSFCVNFVFYVNAP